MIENVPLIQDANDAKQINTSLIALKRVNKELDDKILILNKLNNELDKKIVILNYGLNQEITDRENADNAEVENRNTAIENAVNALDVASVGGIGKYISAISETDGKISATVSDLTSVIESGNNQPATSGGVAGAIQGVTDIASSLPTDAVLHYSFDDVPDYPDGTANYFRNKDFSSTSGWIVPSDYSISVDDNCLKIIPNNSNRHYMLTRETNVMSTSILNGKLAKLKIRSSYVPVLITFQEQVNYSTSRLSLISRSGDEYVYAGVVNFSVNSIVYLVSEKDSVLTSSDYFIIEAIYIGDGSYTTPIIDNANGQNNSIEQSGVAVQGVSGKGLKCFRNNRGNFGDYFLQDNFTLSIWINPENNTSGLQAECVYRYGHFVLRNGWTNSNKLVLFLYAPNDVTLINGGIISELLSPNIWTHIVITKNNLTVCAYINGAKVKTFTVASRQLRRDSSTSSFSVNATINTRPQSYDDLLIFDRALSDTEVQALYQNKANTPKYYNINNYNLKQIKDITAQSTDFADFQSRMAGLATRSLQLIEPTEEDER